MMETLYSLIFGMTLWACGSTYIYMQKKRQNFRRRVMLCTAGYFLLVLIFTFLLKEEIFSLEWVGQVIIFACVFVFLYMCWEVSYSNAFYYTMWAMMSWQMMYEIWYGIAMSLRLYVAEYANWQMVSYILIFAVGNLLLAVTVARWMPEDTQNKIGPRQLISAIVIFTAFEMIGYASVNVEMKPGEGKWLTIYLAQILMLVILYLQSELFKKSAMRQELAVMNMLWKKEQAQYEISKENIAIINQKCHDLKHQIRAIRNMRKEEVEDYLNEIEDSIRIYESIVKTGNEVLDTILTEKSLYCKERGITVSCVADGSQMGFINTIDLYAILGNALDNAIEAVEKFKHQEKRQIDVMIYRQQQFLVINIVNPVKEKLIFGEELPATTKEDRFHHGFGLKSIQYMVKKYDGYLSISEEDGCFSLKILIPIP